MWLFNFTVVLVVMFISHAEAQSSGSGSGVNVCSTGSIILVDGSNETNGRVEICINGEFGTVCDDFWGVSDARVVCRQLGLPWKGATHQSFAHFGQGNGPIVLDDVMCNGTESQLLDCEYDASTIDCTHFEDAGVTCAESIDECVDGDIRLVGGSNDNEGRVEVCILGQWGTVCDDGWNAASAKVACDSLGIPGAANPESYGNGEGIIHIDDISCVGDEDSLFDCSFTNDHNCFHFEDAGVTCGITPECTGDEFQLAGSDDPNQGRVEVCSFGLWGTVCDDSWNANDAAVVCKELGLEYTGAVAYRNAHFGIGDGPIVFDDVQCIGNETSLFDCPYNPNHNCVHFEDAGVMCGSLNCNDSDIRIVNGFSSYEGRVEVCLNGVWGTVCDDFWSENDAQVVCGQLGLPTNYSAAIGSAFFGPGIGPINLDNVFCDGSEASLTDCFYNDVHNCDHSEDASVICVDTQSNCTDGEVRLVGGNNETEGRVEICSDNEWGTICDDQWGNADAQVVCRQLGFSTEGANAVGNANYGQGNGDILLDDVKCTGNESDIFACDYSAIHNCGHSEDAGVQCTGPGNECNHGDVKLVGGSNYTEGRVEVCVNGYWGTVCDDSWTFQDARVVCKQLGYPYTGAKALSFAHYGVGSGRINMDDVQCEGDEELLLNCSYSEEHNCIHAEDAGVECTAAICEEESIRLVGGLNETEGRVEICLGGQWGTICDDQWGASDARVICRQLGYPSSGAEAYSFAYFGQGSGPIVLDNLDCNGDEESILECDFDPDTSDCTHFEDAGIRCLESLNECNDSDVRLVGGMNESEGRVDVCLNGEWGSVCDDFWTQPDAVVVCNQLGYPSKAAQALKEAYFGQGSGKIHIDDVNCLGNETNLLECGYEPDHNCQHFEDASVVCGNPVCNEGDVRLIDGSNMYEGRVELCFNGIWGTVCDDSWSNIDAKVVCNQLGFSEEGALEFSQSYFGSGSGPIQIENVQCGGSESNLLQCNYEPNHNCLHSEDAGVRCLAISPTSTVLSPMDSTNFFPPVTPMPSPDVQSSGSGLGVCSTGSIILVDGSNEANGRVEICINGEFGTVCDDFWGVSDARVVCRQLGLPWKGATHQSFAHFGQGNGPIVLDDVMCNGTESQLLDCEYDASTIDCTHFEDAGVTCAESIDECVDGDIRLVGGSNDNEGRVEVCILGQWGTVCDDGWNAASAKVACDSLGIPGAANPESYGTGEGIIHIDDISCVGDEDSLFDCSFTNDHNCFHFEDAGVTCGITPECTGDQFQLAGSDDPNQGRVEVCSFGLWGTVCDDSWNANDAAVVCKELGLEYTGAVAYRNAHFGIGDGPIVFDDVQCIGNETSLFDCPYNPNHNCVHFEDAGVMCGSLNCNDSDIRIVNGFSSYEGRVEVCLNGVWGTVCDDFWSENDAQVVCGQLGLPTNYSAAIGSAFFGPGIGPINLDNVFCDGSEASLTDCFYNDVHNCDHSEDASVICVDTQSNCTDGEVRLVGGNNETEGRVEICSDNEWGTICDDQWGNADAQVVCRQLGFSTEGANAVGNANYGQGNGDILLDDVKCTGNESDIFACDYSAIHNCGHSEDAGVQCTGPGNECNHGDVKLVGGSNYTEGRVEVCVNGYWGTVCDDSWTFQDARVVCKQLGYPYTGAKALSFAHYGVGSGRINMDDVQCEGDEELLLNCSYSEEHNCVHAEDAGVECMAAVCEEESIRLVGGLNETEGRVEICLGGQWGTICDDQWGASDARVICRQLGYPSSGAEAYSFAYFGQGSGPIVLDNLDCNGDEESILECDFDPDTSDCTHFEDAGIRCLESLNECNDSDVRLVGGKNESEGRVDVCLNGEWGSVCDDFWTQPDAVVVCNQLGYPSKAAQALKEAYFGQGSGKIHIDDVNCLGNETNLLECGYEPDHNCQHFEDASVVCGNPVCNDGDVRLIDGSNMYEGRVELCFNGIWGTVCDDFWSNIDAKVVCNQLGFSEEGALAFSQSYFGSGSGPIQIDDVQCGGSESNLLQCNYQPNHNCFHSEDAGVRCLAISPTSTPTLLGSCGLAEFTSCCNGSIEDNCFGATGDCFCDESCYKFNNCCEDIEDIGCLAPTPTPMPSTGSCADQNFNGCCFGPDCHGSDDICYCDQVCYSYGDCCHDIQDIGCYATTNSPTFDLSSSFSVSTSFISNTIITSTQTTGVSTTGIMSTSSFISSNTQQTTGVSTTGTMSTSSFISSNTQQTTGVSTTGTMSTSSFISSNTQQTTGVSTTGTMSTSSFISSNTQQTTGVSTTGTMSTSSFISSNTQQTTGVSTTGTMSTSSFISSNTQQTTGVSTTGTMSTSSSISSNTQQTTGVSTTGTMSTSSSSSSNTQQTTGVSTTGTMSTSSSSSNTQQTTHEPSTTSSSLNTQSSMSTSQPVTPTPSPLVPGKAINLAIIQMTDSEVTVTWNDPIDSKGISEYHIRIQQRSGSLIKMDIVRLAEGNFSEYKVHDLVPHTPYTVIIIALNDNDDQGPPASLDFFSKEGTPRMAPANVAVVRVNMTAIKVSWDSIPIETAQGFILQYLVVYQLQDGRNPQEIFVGPTANSVVINDLTPGMFYGATVAGITSAGEGAESPITYEEGAGPPQSSGSNARYIAAGASVITVGVGIILFAVLIVSVLVCRKMMKKKHVYNTADIDREMLYYSEKDNGNEIKDFQSETEIKPDRQSHWGHSSEEDMNVGTYTKLPFESKNVNLENEMFEL